MPQNVARLFRNSEPWRLELRHVAGATVLSLLASGCTVWGWGSNAVGQLDPDDDAAGVHEPIAKTTPALDVAVGSAHTCEIRLDRSMWCYGHNGWGQLGTGDLDSRTEPVRIGLDADWRSVEASSVLTCGVRLDDSMWCWGGYPQHEQDPDGSRITPSGLVQVGAGTAWRSVSPGPTSSCAIDTAGALHCWGLNRLAEVGNYATDPVEEPLLIDSGPWASVDVGDGSCGVKTDGTLWCWGRFAPPFTDDIDHPPTQFGTGTNWAHVSTDARHFCAARLDNTVWCWGFNWYGEVGAADEGGWYPEPVEVGAGTGWRRVEAGYSHTCAISLEWELWCWGRNHVGQLGDGTTEDRATPVLIDDSARWLDIAVSIGHTLGISIP